MPLIDCEINFILSCSKNSVIFSTIWKTKFAITDTKLYVPVVTLSIQDNAKLIKQLTFGFKKTINWKKYPSKVSKERQNQYLDSLIDPNFQGVQINVFFCCLKMRTIENYTQHIIFQKVKIKDYNVMIDGKTFLISQLRLKWEHMITFEKFEQVKEMIAQLVDRFK